ncbi:diuretic hormone class 2-like [Periplaneta americana]|uniref:diuretic hormone class 2-like n=1 Tax=Periplaneta americana TaxID=6978 RepID=UPI0037E93564
MYAYTQEKGHTSAIIASKRAVCRSHRNNFVSEQDSEPDSEYVLEMLARLGQSIIRANDLENFKRGLDLGLSRGFSGSQAAKHLMGHAAANYAGDPGRRRRSADESS